MANEKVFQMISEQMIAKIEEAIALQETGQNSIAPWHRPWFQAGIPQNLVSKKAYRGMNVFLLAMLGYASPYFLTFNQARKLGGSVKKGEKSYIVTFWKWVEMDKDQDGKKLDTKKKIPFLRYYRVFNVEQCEGLEGKIPEIPTRVFNPIEEGDAIIKNMPNAPKIEHGESRAFYRPSTDMVNMPKHELFEGDEEYYSVIFHELSHSTGHTSRLNRKEVMDHNSFGNHSYSREELVAEMAAVFLCNMIGCKTTFDNSLAYLKNWLTALKDDTKMLVVAAGRAQKAADYILNENEKKETQVSQA